MNEHIEQLRLVNPEALLLEVRADFDRAVIGWTTDAGGSWGRGAVLGVAVYSVELVLDVLIGLGMDEESALEWFYYNIDGAYLGEHTPVFVWDGEE